MPTRRNMFKTLGLAGAVGAIKALPGGIGGSFKKPPEDVKTPLPPAIVYTYEPPLPHLSSGYEVTQFLAQEYRPGPYLCGSRACFPVADGSQGFHFEQYLPPVDRVITKRIELPLDRPYADN